MTPRSPLHGAPGAAHFGAGPGGGSRSGSTSRGRACSVCGKALADGVDFSTMLNPRVVDVSVPRCRECVTEIIGDGIMQLLGGHGVIVHNPWSGAQARARRR